MDEITTSSPVLAKPLVMHSCFSICDLTQFGVVTYLSEENGMAEIKSNEQELYYDYSSKSYKFRSPVYHVKIWRLRHCAKPRVIG